MSADPKNASRAEVIAWCTCSPTECLGQGGYPAGTCAKGFDVVGLVKPISEPAPQRSSAQEQAAMTEKPGAAEAHELFQKLFARKATGEHAGQKHEGLQYALDECIELQQQIATLRTERDEARAALLVKPGWTWKQAYEGEHWHKNNLSHNYDLQKQRAETAEATRDAYKAALEKAKDAIEDCCMTAAAAFNDALIGHRPTDAERDAHCATLQRCTRVCDEIAALSRGDAGAGKEANRG